MRISDWSSDVCSSDLPGSSTCASSTASRRLDQALEKAWNVCQPSPGVTSASRSLKSLEKRLGEDSCSLRAAKYAKWHNLSLFRSEEHTSELQSLMRISYAVFCLKNKNKYKRTKTTKQNTNLNKH